MHKSETESAKARRFLLVFLFLLVVISSPAGAQTHREGYRYNATLDLKERLGLQGGDLDTTEAGNVHSPDSTAVKRNIKSPLVAVLLSAAIPGGGQVYNGSYWKVPIIIGVQTFFISQWISSNKVYQSYRSQFADSLAAGPPYNLSDYQRQYNLSNLEKSRNATRDQRDSYAWYIAGVYLVSMLDAYVDAELSGFDISPNLSSTPSGATVAVGFRLKF